MTPGSMQVSFVNQLTSIPPEIGQFTSLKELSVHWNQLTSIPHEIGQLVVLKSLYLAEDLMTDIPPEIGQLALLGHWLVVEWG